MVALIETEELKSNFVLEADIPNLELNLTLPLDRLDVETKTYTTDIRKDQEQSFKVTRESETDILVVGAGPVGLLLCIQLARLDDRPEVNNYQRAILFHARTVEIFQQLGLYNLIKKNPSYEKADILGYSSYLDGEMKYNVQLPNPTNCTIDHQIGIYQSELEKCMIQLLKTQFHFEVQRNNKFIKLEYFPNSTKVKSALFENLQTGEIERVYCKYLVGSDGGKSEIRKQGQFKFEGHSYDASLLLLDIKLNVEKSILPTDLKIVNAFWTEKCSLVWVKPKTSDRFVLYYPNLAEANSLTPEGCIKVVNDIIKPYKVDVKSVLRYGSTNAHERIVHQMYTNNLFLVGDAAHVHTPAGGMGVNLGIQDAYNLGFKLVLINNPNSAIIKDQVALSYHLERKSEAKRVLSYSGKIVRTNMTPNNYLNMLETRAKASSLGFGTEQEQQNMSENIAMTEYVYPSNPLLLCNEDDPDVKAVVGKRFPHLIIFEGTKSKPRAVLELLSGLQFEIFILIPTSLNLSHKCTVKEWYLELDNFVTKLNGLQVLAKWTNITYSLTGEIEESSDSNENGLTDLELHLYRSFNLKSKSEEVQLFVIRPDSHLALSKSLYLDSPIGLKDCLMELFAKFIRF